MASAVALAGVSCRYGPRPLWATQSIISHFFMETEPPPSSAVDEDKPLAEKPKSAAEAADFANYFCTYGFLYHQKQMLTDNLRMEAYYSAVFENSEHFKDKVVLDVGTGSGILAMWAARAGARKVYAVEYTDMARFARQLVADNRLSEIVEVIQGSVETIELPEKVDIIISEWMGYFLMRESMLDSVIIARDRFLKPTGAMYPSHARIYLAPITREQERYRAMTEFHNSMSAWKDFTGDMSRRFGVNFRCLTEAYTKEQKEYFLGTTQWVELEGEQLVGTEAEIMNIDCRTCTLDEIKALTAIPFACRITNASDSVSAFAGWFDVDFAGAPGQEARRTITLSTSPTMGYTHWGQQCFFIAPNPLQLSVGDEIRGSLDMTRRLDNHRLLNVSITYAVHKAIGTSEAARASAEPESAPTTLRFTIE